MYSMMLFYNYKDGISVLLQILGAENKEETGMFKKYYWVMPIAKFARKIWIGQF